MNHAIQKISIYFIMLYIKLDLITISIIIFLKALKTILQFSIFLLNMFIEITSLSNKTRFTYHEVKFVDFQILIGLKHLLILQIIIICFFFLLFCELLMSKFQKQNSKSFSNYTRLLRNQSNYLYRYFEKTFFL